MNYYIYTIGVLVIAAMLMAIVDRAFCASPALQGWGHVK